VRHPVWHATCTALATPLTAPDRTDPCRLLIETWALHHCAVHTRAAQDQEGTKTPATPHPAADYQWVPGRHYHFTSQWQPFKPAAGPLQISPLVPCVGHGGGTVAAAAAEADDQHHLDAEETEELWCQHPDCLEVVTSYATAALLQQHALSEHGAAYCAASSTPLVHVAHSDGGQIDDEPRRLQEMLTANGGGGQCTERQHEHLLVCTARAGCEAGLRGRVDRRMLSQEIPPPSDR
jgi:hypothetical protein